MASQHITDQNISEETIHETEKLPYKFHWTHVIPIVVGLLSLGYMLLVSGLIGNSTLPTFGFTIYDTINRILTMQIFILPLSFVDLGILYLYNPKNFREFFHWGNIGAPAHQLKFLGIKEGTSWKKVGISIALILTVGTAIFMTIGVIMQGGVVNRAFFALWPLGLLFSLSNAWNEEIFSRFTIVTGLKGKVPPRTSYWISALVFGIPHYFGTPGGITGSLMAGFLGWLLAKSIYETKGIFWSWFIHFVQDVVIFTASIMIMLATI